MFKYHGSSLRVAPAKTLLTHSSLAVLTLIAVPSGLIADEMIVSDAITANALPWTRTFSVPRFDPAFGTLQSVALSLNATPDGWFVARNDTGENFDYTARITTAYELSLPDLTALPQFLVTATRWYGTPPHTTGAYHYSALAAGLLMETSAAGVLSQFSGVGTAALPLQAFLSAFDGGGGPAFLDAATASSMIEVTYRFAPVPVPEPSSTLVELAGAALVLLLARRRSLRGPLVGLNHAEPPGACLKPRVRR